MAAHTRQDRTKPSGIGPHTADTLISSAGAATKVIDAVKLSDEITVEAWTDRANLSQNGPARIVTISGSPVRTECDVGSRRVRLVG